MHKSIILLLLVLMSGDEQNVTAIYHERSLHNLRKVNESFNEMSERERWRVSERTGGRK